MKMFISLQGIFRVDILVGDFIFEARPRSLTEAMICKDKSQLRTHSYHNINIMGIVWLSIQSNVVINSFLHSLLIQTATKRYPYNNGFEVGQIMTLVINKPPEWDLLWPNRHLRKRP